MSLSFRLGRIAAVIALLASGATFAIAGQVAPAGATSAAFDQSCEGQSFETANIDNNEILTVTIVAGDCARVTFQSVEGTATATLNGGPLTIGTPAVVTTGDVIVVTAPASGMGRGRLTFDDVNAGVPVISYTYGYPPLSGSLAAPGDGSLIVTYSGVVPMQQGVVLFLAPQGSSCTGSNIPNEVRTMVNPPDDFEYVLDAQQINPGGPWLGASPSIVTAGTEADSFDSPEPVAIVAGTYQACLFSYPPLSLLQSLEVTLGEVAPTTTTTAADDPVTPAYTG